MKKLVIIGAGGHGRVAADIARLIGYSDIVFLDDADMKTTGEYSVVGCVADFEKYADCEFFVAFGDNELRERVAKRLSDSGAKTVTLIHPSAVLAENTVIGKGTVIMAGAVINTGTVIGENVIINTCSSVDHDCMIGDCTHIAIGARIAGEVKVGKRVFAGAGSVVIHDIKICDDVVLGAGAVVIRNISEKGLYVGTPACFKK